MTTALLSTLLWIVLLPLSLVWWVVKGFVRLVLGMLLVGAIIAGVVLLTSSP